MNGWRSSCHVTPSTAPSGHSVGFLCTSKVERDFLDAGWDGHECITYLRHAVYLFVEMATHYTEAEIWDPIIG